MGDDWREKKEARHYRNLYTHLRNKHGFDSDVLARQGSAQEKLKMLHLVDHALRPQEHYHKTGVA
jgi:hypothetical protein